MAVAVKPIVELSITYQLKKPNNDTVNLFGSSPSKKDLKKNDDEEFQSYINLINYDGSANSVESPQALDFHKRHY